MRKFFLSILASLGLILILGTTPNVPGLAQNATEASTAVKTTEPGSSPENALLNPCTKKPFHTILTGSDLASAEAKLSNYGDNQYIVAITIKDSAADAFAAFTTQAAKIQGKLAIVLDGQVLLAPIIQAPLVHDAVINGNLDKDKATQLAVQLQSGALPVKLTIKSSSPTSTGLQYALTPLTITDPDKLQETQRIMITRLKNLGIQDAEVNVVNDEIVVKLVSPQNPDALLEAISKPALLEFVDFIPSPNCQANMPQPKQYIRTDFQLTRKN